LSRFTDTTGNLAILTLQKAKCRNSWKKTADQTGPCLSISIAVFLLKIFILNSSTVNYQTNEKYRLVNKASNLSPSLMVILNDVTNTTGDSLVDKE
jgi:hypothetical protein